MNIPNYSAQDYKHLKKKDKDKLKKDLEQDGRSIEDFEAEIKKGWPREVRLPPAKWRHR